MIRRKKDKTNSFPLNLHISESSKAMNGNMFLLRRTSLADVEFEVQVRAIYTGQDAQCTRESTRLAPR